MKSSHLRMLLLLGALGLACSPESAFSQEKAAAQAYAGKTVTGEVTVKQTVEDTLQSHRGLKVMQENLDVVRHELRRAKAGVGPERRRRGAYRCQPVEQYDDAPFERR